MPITISPRIEARLREKAVREGQDVDDLADLLLNMALEWDAQDHAEAVAGIQRGLEAVEQEQSRPFREFAAEQRAKYNLPTKHPTTQ